MNSKLKNFHIDFFHELLYVIKKNNLSYHSKKYEKNQIIFIANSKCERIGIILNGKISIEHVLKDGKKVTINIIEKYDIFGEILLFSDENIYPYNIIANTKCEVMFLSRDVLLSILNQNTFLLNKFLFHISESYMTLNKYIKLKSQKNIVSKLAFYFLQYANIDSNNLICKLNTKSDLANFLGVERQSLIRELNNLKSKNILSYDKKNIYLKDITFFEKIVN